VTLYREFTLMVGEITNFAVETGAFRNIFIEIINRRSADCIQHRGAVFWG
jgi:hypothetical protein